MWEDEGIPHSPHPCLRGSGAGAPLGHGPARPHADPNVVMCGHSCLRPSWSLGCSCLSGRETLEPGEGRLLSSVSQALSPCDTLCVKRMPLSLFIFSFLIDNIRALDWIICDHRICDLGSTVRIPHMNPRPLGSLGAFRRPWLPSWKGGTTKPCPTCTDTLGTCFI